jgi:hypothetical protein
MRYYITDNLKTENDCHMTAIILPPVMYLLEIILKCKYIWIYFVIYKSTFMGSSSCAFYAELTLCLLKGVFVYSTKTVVYYSYCFS